MPHAQQAHLKLTDAERGPLRSIVRDIQLSVRDFYELTARTGDVDELGTHVRTFLTNVQQLDESLAQRVADSASYETLLSGSRGKQLIDAVKYARNVVQHVLHIVRPAQSTSLIGGMHGLRTYAYWDVIPQNVDAQLRPGTRALRPSYMKCVEGREVVDVMLDVLRAFWRIAPDIVHRDEHDKWTGFPLRSQPGVGSRFHPEEPSDVVGAEAWLNARRPNGSHRLICGQQTVAGQPLIYGFTFIGPYTFSPFVETSEQVDKDIANGANYVVGEINGHLEDATAEFSQGLQGSVYRSATNFTEWTEQILSVEPTDDWSSAGANVDWARVIRTERGGMPAEVAYGIRRARRLNAYIPSRK